MASDAQGPWEGLTIGNGRYRNLTTIGVGGMGYVYRAVDGNLSSDVVIKSPRASMLEDRIVAERFEREIGAMVKLSFPHIVKVMDVGRHEGIAFAVMPFLAGGNLYKRMVLGTDGTPAPLAWRTMRGWLPNVAAALDFVHRSHYVHRDVKPQNILFDRYSLAYLSDFGIVKAVGLTVGAETRFQTSEGFNAGTIDYMSPEVLTAQRFDGRADQYSLAVTVYQYLTGVLPFASESIVVTIDRHLHLVPKLVGDLVAGIPPHVSAAVARAMSKAPADRFPDCTQFIRTLLTEPPAGTVAQPVHTAIVAGASSADSTGSVATIATSTPVAPKPAAPRSAPAETGAGFSLAPPTAAPPTASAASPRSSSAPIAGTPSATGAPSRPVGGAETARIPNFKRPAQGRARFWKSAAPWQRVAVVISLLGIAAAIGVGAVLTFDTDLPPSTGLDTNHLPRLIDDWKKQATEVERVAVIDSKAMLEKLEYSDRKELEQLLDAAGTKAPPDVTAAINTLEIDLTTLARVHQARSEQLTLLRDAAKKSPQTDPKTLERYEVEDTELKDQGTQLVAMAHRLKTLRDSTQLSRSAYDAPAMAELRLLDDMERIVAAEEPVAIESATIARAETLASERNPDLAWRALNVLARSSTLAHVQVAVVRLNTFTPERRAELAYSLLISSQADAIVAATRLLRDDPEVRGHLKRERLLHLAELYPSRYQDLIAPLASTSTTSDERFRIFCVQAQAMRDDWSIDVEKACSDGLLRDRADEVVVEIIERKRKKSYPLAERLLTKSRDLPIHRFTGEELKPLVAEAPALASVLAEQWVLRGTVPLRKAAISAYAALDSSLDKLRLRKALASQKRSIRVHRG